MVSDQTLVIDQSITLTVRITNTSTNEPTNTDPVPATLTGTTVVQLACTTSNCATPLPGTLTFVSCTPLQAGVASCILDPSDLTNNTVLVNMTAGGVTIPAAGQVDLATITVTAATPVVSPANGQFFARSDTGPNDLEACEQPAGTPCTTGGGQGSTTMFFPAVCGDGIVNQDFETCDSDPPGTPPVGDECCPAIRADASPNICGTPPGTQVGCPANGQSCRAPGGTDECTICGDGIVQVTSGEACDDGNANNDDSCTNACLVTTTTTSTSTSTSTSSTSTSTSTSSTSTSTSTSSTSTSTSSTTSTSVPVICRTPGFWGTHAADGSQVPKKPNAQNITGFYLALAQPLTICGTLINNTQFDPPSQNSAIEALCVAPRGDQRLQLARQLTAAYLNCQIETCPAGVLTLLETCNNACVANNDATAIGECIEDVDAFNNGVSELAPGCHDQAIPDFTPPGPAGSGQICGAATNNGCTIFSCP